MSPGCRRKYDLGNAKDSCSTPRAVHGKRHSRPAEDARGIENKGIAIPTQVQWLGNTGTIRERRQNGEIAVTSGVFVVKGCKVAQSLINKALEAAGVWY